MGPFTHAGVRPVAFLVALYLPATLVLAADCVVPSATVTGSVTLRAAPAVSSAPRGTIGQGQGGHSSPH